MQSKKSPQNKIENPIHVIGTDAAGLITLPLFLQELILSSQKIAAPERILSTIPQWWADTKSRKALPEMFASDKPQELIIWLKSQNTKTIVLASGDPLWFGIGRCLIESLPPSRLRFHPCTTSLQLAFARLGRTWQDASWISLHGRDSSHLAKVLQKRPKALAILTDPSRGGAEEVRTYLRASGLEKSYAFWVCEQLGHPQERVQKIMPVEELPIELHPLHLVVLLAEKASTSSTEVLPLFGIDDGFYLQHDDQPGLMTKREIRVQLIADLELPAQGVLWDIGAGVGSVGLEALRLRPKLRLLAIEKRIGACALISANAKRLFVNPSAIIEAEALEVLSDHNFSKNLSKPDRAILGGGGKYRKKLLEIIVKRLKPGGIVVIPVVTLEAASELIVILKKSHCKLNISQHQPWRGVPLANGTRLAPINPVFIIKGKVL